MQRETSTDSLVAAIQRAAERGATHRAGLSMPWHLRMRRSFTNWLCAWQQSENDAVVAELRRQVSAIRAQGREKP